MGYRWDRNVEMLSFERLIVPVINVAFVLT